jgi:hypothetical protein
MDQRASPSARDTHPHVHRHAPSPRVHHQQGVDVTLGDLRVGGREAREAHQ